MKLCKQSEPELLVEGQGLLGGARSMAMAISRMEDRLRETVASRVPQRSSPQVMPRVEWQRFSMPQCPSAPVPRTSPASRLASASMEQRQ